MTLDETGEAHWRHMGRSPADVVAELVIAAAQGRRLTTRWGRVRPPDEP